MEENKPLDNYDKLKIKFSEIHLFLTMFAMAVFIFSIFLYCLPNETVERTFSIATFIIGMTIIIILYSFIRRSMLKNVNRDDKENKKILYKTFKSFYIMIICVVVLYLPILSININALWEKYRTGMFIIGEEFFMLYTLPAIIAGAVAYCSCQIISFIHYLILKLVKWQNHPKK